MTQAANSQPPAAPTKSADKFEYLLPYAKALLRPEEAGDCLGFERSFVYTLILEGKLEAHSDPDREKPHYRVTRRSVLAYLAKTAQYEPDDFIDVLELLIKTLSGPQIDRLIARATRIRKEKS